MLPLSPHDPPVLGVHRLHARLGEDACTRVYLASAPGGPPCALKIVRSEYTFDPAFRDAFTHLVDSARGTNSRYVAPVVDADPRAATPWVALSRPLGPTLAEVVDAHGPLPPAALHPLALALAQGLADLHAAGHVHGSLWPDGVLIAREHAVIADAGFESAASEVDRRPPHPSFAAPEGGTTPATDVFAWAATLCFAASGVKGPAGLDRVPLQLRGLVEACLKVRPVLRPDSVDLVHMLGGPAPPGPWRPDLAAVIDRHETEARRFLHVHGSQGEKGRVRRRVPALVAAGLALALVAGVGVAWGLSRSAPGPGKAGAAFEPRDSGLITDVGCREGAVAFPAPSGEIDDLDATGVAFSPDGDILAISSLEHGLGLWSWREGEEVARPAGALDDRGGPLFTPIGCTVSVLARTPYEGEGGVYTTVTTHDLSAGTSVEHPGPQPQRAQEGLVRPQAGLGAAFSPSGDLMAVFVDSSPELHKVGIVDTATGEQIAEWGQEWPRSVQHLRFLDEERVVAGGFDSITIRDAISGEEQRLIRDATTSDFALLPGGNEIVYVGNEHLIHWNHEEGVEPNRFPILDFSQAWEDGARITDLSVDADLGLLHFSWSLDVPGTDGRLREHHGHLFDLGNGTDLLAEDDSPAPRPVAFHPDGEVIAAIQRDGSVALLDPGSLETTRALP